jgi:hypothetical protein
VRRGWSCGEPGPQPLLNTAREPAFANNAVVSVHAQVQYRNT